MKKITAIGKNVQKRKGMPETQLARLDLMHTVSWQNTKLIAGTETKINIALYDKVIRTFLWKLRIHLFFKYSAVLVIKMCFSSFFQIWTCP